MKTLALIACAALAAGPAFAQNAAVTPAPDRDAAGVYQVFRTTDNQLSCEQLTSEMNLLNSQIKKQADASQKKQGSGAGRAAGGAAVGGLLAGAARYGIARNIPGLGYAGAQAAVAATDAASRGVGDAVAKGGQQQAAAPVSVSDEQQRMNRVAQLFAAKSC
jgi:hypothetical protein